MTRTAALHTESSWAEAISAFASSPLAELPESGPSTSPAIGKLNQRMSQWQRAMNAGFVAFPDLSVAAKLGLTGRLVAEGLYLRTDLDTAEVLTWLQDPATSPEDRADFDRRRQELVSLLNSLAEVCSEVFRKANFAMPSERGHRAWLVNASKLAQLFGGRRFGPLELGFPSVLRGLGRIARQERSLVVSAVGRQLRSTSLLGWANRHRVDSVNRRLKKQNNGQGADYRLDYSRAEHLRAAHRVLHKAGVRFREADRLVDRALALGQASSGKPWRGLIHLRELVVHAERDPSDAEFLAHLEVSLVGPIHYSHTPGREWLVRDFSLARALLKADGKVCRTTENVAITQAGASIAPGVLANNPALLRLAAHYMKPIQVHLNGVVAQSGSEHRRHKNVFQGYFRKGEVLDRVEFIESTVGAILDDVERVAARNGGRFDFKTDLAFNFPIRVICHFMGIPVDDAPKVQHWAEAAVRSLDAGAGLSLNTLTEGNRSAGDFLAYLTNLVERRRNGEDIPGIIGEVATTAELTDIELVSNLAGITFAGFETTTGLLSMGFAELLRHPDQVAYLRNALAPGPELAAVTDADVRWYVWAHHDRKGRVEGERLERYERLSDLVAQSDAVARRLAQIESQESALGGAVEEMLRWTAPGSVIPLTMAETFVLESPLDTVVHGQPVAVGEPITFHKGQTITVDVAGANRSGCPFGRGQFEATAGDFDVSRSDNTSHLSFGVTHICMGADLAVENAKRMIEAILRRIPDLELDGLPDEADGNLFVGLETLPVRSATLARGNRSGVQSFGTN